MIDELGARRLRRDNKVQSPYGARVSGQRAATANVLGANALAIATELNASGAASRRSDSDLAALSALDQFVGGASIDRLRDVLGLTHSGTVRLLQRLVAAGLVNRGPGVDGRTRAVTLTVRGRRAARGAANRRADYLDAVLGDLSTRELDQLCSLLERLSNHVVQIKDGGPWICRRCDVQACGRYEGHCPVATAAADKYDATA
jgi:DNA-binding MarR family transcriptional regulator